jgi:type II secretory pathway component PulF
MKEHSVSSAKPSSELASRIIKATVAGTAILYFLLLLLPRLKVLLTSLGGREPTSSSLLIRGAEFAASSYGIATLIAIAVGIRSYLWWRKKSALRA